MKMMSGTTIYDPCVSTKIKSAKSSGGKKKKNINIKTEKYKKPKDALLSGVCLISDDEIIIIIKMLNIKYYIKWNLEIYKKQIIIKII